MLLPTILDYKVILYQIKVHWYLFVPPYDGCVATLVVSIWCDIFGREIVFYLSCLWESVHSFYGISIYMYIFLHTYEVVLFYYLLWYDVEYQANIFIPFHGGPQIKILDVAANEARLWS